MKYWIVLFLVTIATSMFAQGIKVIDVKEIVSGTDAFHTPIDGNDLP